MIQIFKDVRIDWLANRRAFIAVSVLLMLGGLFRPIIRQATGHQAFNLGVDFKGGTVVTVKFKQRPGDEAIRAALSQQGIRDAIVQPSLTNRILFWSKLPLEGRVSSSRSEIRPVRWFESR